MSNATYNLADIIVAKGLAIISNKMAFIKNINRAYEPKFNLQVEDHRVGTTIRIPKPARRSATLRSGWTINVQPIVEEVTSLTINTPVGDDTAFQDSDLALLIPDPEKNIDDWGKRFIAPRVSNIANQIENTVLGQAMVLTNNLVGTPGIVPQSSQTIAQAKQKLDENLAPDDDRYFLHSAATAGGLSEALKSSLDKGIAEESLIRGYEGELYDAKMFMTELVPNHTNGTFGTDSVVTQNSGSPQTGSSLITTGWTSTHGVNAGDIFTIAGVYAVNYSTKQQLSNLQQFVVTQTATNSSGTLTMSISPSIVTSGADQTVSNAPAINSALTFVGSSATLYRQNMMFHRDAFTIAFAKLFLPEKGVEMAAQKTADGITMRYVRAWDVVTSQLYDRIDVYYGFGGLYTQWATRITE